MTTNGTATIGSRFRHFDLAEQEGEPCGFSLGDDTFTCTPLLTAGAGRLLLGIAGRVVPLDESIAFIEAVLDDNDLERFRVVINRKHPAVPGGVIGDIVNHLIEVYSARPTQPPTA
jgi:hypothetical protein